METAAFDLEVSRRYWRLAPSGAGKHDTSQLLTVSDDVFFKEWCAAFEARFANYPEEDLFLAKMGVEFSGKTMLSIGSGLGLHEIYYAGNGAQLACYDIVPSNLQTIGRIAKSLGLPAPALHTDVDEAFSRRYDVVFFYGSLMTMPQEQQAAILARCKAALNPGGVIVLMLYTWEFARATCGWESPDQFDPLQFARASDPSVGAEHCPWSDWHDDEKLLRLAGGDMSVRRRQYWQQGWFVWYELVLSGPLIASPGQFFSPDDVLAVRQEIDLTLLEPAEASLLRNASGAAVLETSQSLASYAALSSVNDADAFPSDANTVLLEASVEEGAFSIGVLDAEKDTFVASTAIMQSGRQAHLLTLPAVPKRFRLVFSNFRSSVPATSRFTLFGATLGRRASAAGLFIERVRSELRA